MCSWSISVEDDAKLAAEVIEQEPHSAWYHHPQLFRRDVHPIVKAALDASIAEPDDDIPW